MNVITNRMLVDYKCGIKNMDQKGKYVVLNIKNTVDKL